ncbi:G-protein coupled receptor Mth2-like [Pomacea canaliculata]|uniref:G-protein coupled receptor Mth2-like n=1 Tax=Pomacea canaliculata TaxID=400727 RepID=UPI000D72559C|nr:G-protein coupled receptor Mth2-like [Pomacea canaliculata]
MPLCHTKGATMLSNSSFMLENGVLVVLPYGKRYTSHEFVIRADGTAVVCNSSPVDDEKYFLWFRFYLVEQLATFACLLVSIVSLLLVLLTYSLLPQLRNVPGIIVMSLSASMLTMQVLMLLFLIPRGWLCLAVAWLLHWSLLATFLWNSALAFDLAFTSPVNPLATCPRGQEVVSCGVTSCCAGCCRCLSSSASVSWITTVSTTWATLPELMQKSTTSSQGPYNPVDKRRLFVYIRITLIMGFTWAVGFTAAFVQLEELWIANIVLNASQGFYFLIAFVLKRRVWSLVWDRFSSLRSSRSGSLHPHRKTRPCQAASWKPLQR